MPLQRYALSNVCRAALVFAMLGSTQTEAFPSSQAEEQANHGWSQLLVLSPGSRVRLTLHDRSEVTGRIVRTHVEALVLDDIRTGRSGIRTRAGASLRDGVAIERAAVATIEVLSVATPRVADSFAQLKLLAGRGADITVTDAAGRRISGRITDLSPSTLSLLVHEDRREFHESDVISIRRRGDTMLNGTLLGLGIGAAVGSVGVMFCGKFCAGGEVPLIALYAAVGAGIGVATDAMMRSEHVIYQSPVGHGRITLGPPIVQPHPGLLVSLRF